MLWNSIRSYFIDCCKCTNFSNVASSNRFWVVFGLYSNPSHTKDFIIIGSTASLRSMKHLRWGLGLLLNIYFMKNGLIRFSQISCGKECIQFELYIVQQYSILQRTLDMIFTKKKFGPFS